METGYQDSDSSDDGVCFGEYTIKEAKKYLQKKYVARKINRRHTFVCTMGESQTSSREQISMLPILLQEKNNISADSNTCGYLTASEGMLSDRLSQTSDFLEKLAKAIDESVSEASYNTAFDQTHVPENANFQCDDTFLERFKNQTTFALDKIHQTLVENTVISTNDSLSQACNFNYQNKGSLNESINNGSIISISDESLSHLEKSSCEILPNQDLNVSRSSILSNEEKCKELQEVFITSSKQSPKILVTDHANSLCDRSTELQSESNDLYILQNESIQGKSSFGFKSLDESYSGTELKEYSCNMNSDSTGYLSDEQDSSLNLSFNLNPSGPEPAQRFERIIVDCNQLSKISEKTEFTTCIGDNSSSCSIQQVEKSKDLLPENLSSSEKCKDLKVLKKCIQEPKKFTAAEVYETNFSSSAETSKTSNFSSSSETSKTSSISSKPDLSKNSEMYKHLQCSKMTPKFDDSCEFDDTLEEMNRLLEQGVDYQMPETTRYKVTPLKEPFGSDEIISGSFMNTSSNCAGLENKTPETRTLKPLERKMFYSAEKISKPSREGKWPTTVKCGHQRDATYKPPLKSATILFTKHVEKVEGAEFKLPTKPIKKLPTPSKLPKPTLKSVVSPVGVYIKHSPKYCPMIRVSRNTGNSHINLSKLVGPSSTLFKENIPRSSNQEIPKIIYRPAKYREIKEQKDITLPGSIKKLIKEQVVTIHKERIQDDECNQSIERRLQDSDLSIDLSHGRQDISIVTNQQPFNIRKF